MMKKLFVLGIVLAMVMGLAAMAGAYEMFVGVKGADGTGQLIDVGDYQGAGFDAGWNPGNGAQVTAAVQQTGGSTDLTAAFDPNHVSSTAWDIYVWGVGADAGATASIYVIFSDDGTIAGGSSAKGNDWNLNVVGGASYAAGALTLDANYPPNITDGNKVISSLTVGASRASAVELQLVEGAPVTTPEPGSLVALFSGMVGLVGYGIRRRK